MTGRMQADPPTAAEVNPSSVDHPETEERLLAQIRAVTAIAPAVAHDLRAPINAMVLNLEMLKETLASDGTGKPVDRERLLRYTRVVRDELGRLHRGLEIFFAQLHAQNPNPESCDLGELANELGSLLTAPARKRQVAVKTSLPTDSLRVEARRFLLRQALLHYGLATLGAAAPSGSLEIQLSQQPGRFVLRLTAAPVEAGWLASTTPALAVAEQLWTQEGGRAKASAPSGDSVTYELEWPVAEVS
jgi:K+-sensing histidine kinase KdpD